MPLYTLQELSNLHDALQQQMTDLLSNSREIEELPVATVLDTTDRIAIQKINGQTEYATRSQFLTLLASQIRRIDDDPLKNEVDGVGQIAIGKKTGIADGQYFIGITTNANPTTDAHFEQPLIYQVYE